MSFLSIRCSSEEMLNPEEIQEFLDEGMTPKSLFDRGVTAKQLYGKTYEGGFIFYFNSTFGDGKIAAFEDSPSALTWYKAISYCENLTIQDNDDWLLPEMDDLKLMWKNLADSDGDAYSYGPDDPFNLGSFEYEIYHSATEIGFEGSRSLSFYDGLQWGGSKDSSFHVRAARAF